MTPKAYSQLTISPHITRYILFTDTRTIDILVDDNTGYLTSLEIRRGTKAKQRILVDQWEKLITVPLGIIVNGNWSVLETKRVPVQHFLELLK